MKTRLSQAIFHIPQRLSFLPTSHFLLESVTIFCLIQFYGLSFGPLGRSIVPEVEADLNLLGVVFMRVFMCYAAGLLRMVVILRHQRPLNLVD